MDQNKAPIVVQQDVPKTLMGCTQNQIFSVLSKWDVMFQRFLPQTINKSRFIQVAAFCIGQNADLMKCTTKSILGAVLQSASLGLDLAPALGQAYILPFGSEAVFVLGYKGMVTMLYDSGEVASVFGDVYRIGDQFLYEYGTNPFVKHVKSLDEFGDLKAAYAIIKLKSGEIIPKVLSKYEVIEVHKKRSPARNSKHSPWNVPEFEHFMWIKSALKECCKTAPLSLATLNKLNVDNAVLNEENFVPEGLINPAAIKYVEDTESEIASDSNKEIDNMTKRLEAKKDEVKKGNGTTKTTSRRRNGRNSKTQAKPEKVEKPDEKQLFFDNWESCTQDERTNKFINECATFDIGKYVAEEKIDIGNNELTYSNLPLKAQVDILWINTEPKKGKGKNESKNSQKNSSKKA